MQVKKISWYIPFVLMLLLSCSKSDSGNCVSSKTIQISSIDEEANFDGLKLVFTNENYKVYFSKYLSSNGDGIRDGSGIFILKLDTGIAYSSYDFFANQNNYETTSDPTNYFTSGSLKITDNCSQVYDTENINMLAWFPTYQSSLPQGIYHAELKLKLVDNTDLNVNTDIQLIRFN